MATNSNTYRYPPYGVYSVPPYPQQQPVYNGIPYPPLQIAYPQPPPIYYPQYQQQPIMTSPPNGNVSVYPPDAILFYDDNKPYYELTNFARFGFDLDGAHWPTSEHYFQAQKFDGYPQKKSQVGRLAAPRDAFDFVRRPENKAFIRTDWSAKKDEIMYEALRAKFTQNQNLRKLLLETNDRMLVEDSPIDPYWGIGKDRTGKNKLGELLMKLRTELRNSHSTHITRLPPATPAPIMGNSISLKRSASLSHLNSFHSMRFSDSIEYDGNDSTHFLSNSFKAYFQLESEKWPTVLHYFVAKKFGLQSWHVKKILVMNDCKDVHLYSRNSMNKQGTDFSWDLDKKSIMKEALRAKFEQNVVLRQKLLDTGDKDIVEVSQNDSYWSQLPDGTGRNIMGMLLSQVRLELRSLNLTKHVPRITPKDTTPAVSRPYTKDSNYINISSLHNGQTYDPITNQPSELRRKSIKISPQNQDATINNLTADLSRTKLTNSIHFFHADPLKEYSELSTFYVSRFYLDGKDWSSVQHYFQAQKYATGLSQWLMDKIRTADSPKKAYEMGTDWKNSHLLVKRWISEREGVMMRALKAKFNDTTLRHILVSTGDRQLAHDSTEEFWGMGRDGKGKNMLGQLLTTIRKELTETNSPSKHNYQPYQSSYNEIMAFTTSHTNSLSSNRDVIRFYEEYKPFYEFTPYSKHSVKMNGVKWPTLNHYFQAQKFTNQKYRDDILKAATPQRATYLAETPYSQFKKPLNTAKKLSIMEKGLTAKLIQHRDILLSLISTGDKHILFVHPTDIVWGTGSDMKGSNLLGVVLMNLRSKLSTSSHSVTSDALLSSDDEVRIRKFTSTKPIRKIHYPPKACFRTKLFVPVLIIALFIIPVILAYCYNYHFNSLQL